MTDADIADCLRLAADCLACARFCPSETEEAREYAAMAATKLPADLAAQVARALDCGDHRWLDGLANALEPPAPTPQPKPRRMHRHKPRTAVPDGLLTAAQA